LDPSRSRETVLGAVPPPVFDDLAIFGRFAGDEDRERFDELEGLMGNGLLGTR
jgi:hypothetical protein